MNPCKQFWETGMESHIETWFCLCFYIVLQTSEAEESPQLSFREFSLLDFPIFIEFKHHTVTKTFDHQYFAHFGHFACLYKQNAPSEKVLYVGSY